MASTSQNEGNEEAEEILYWVVRFALFAIALGGALDGLFQIYKAIHP